ncbi:MAG: TM2 domain-containing protein [Eubacteriaceae bacterium]|jgi:hypothetical protein|nr:TM2 domain-containing protein [Eubacteriaceae bacterium]
MPTKYCQFCGKQLEAEAKFCPYCGKSLDASQNSGFAYQAQPQEQSAPIPDSGQAYDDFITDKNAADHYYEDLNRRYGTSPGQQSRSGEHTGYSSHEAWSDSGSYGSSYALKPKNKWLSLALLICTGCGHKFYEEKIGMGLLYFFTGCLFGVGWLVDLIKIASGPETYYV